MKLFFSFSATASLLRMLTIRGEADHHGPFISLLFCYVYGDWVYVTIYIYMYSNPKKYRKTIYSYFTTGSYQLLLYIYTRLCIYIDTHTFTIKDSRTLVRPLLGSYREHPGLQYRLGGNRWEHKTGLDRTLCIYIMHGLGWYIYI